MAATSNPKSVATAIRRLREKSGISVEELAVKTGLSRAAIHHIEAGTRKPSLDTARKIAKALGISLAEFD